jgi:SAM-dependent methyltransferase
VIDGIPILLNREAVPTQVDIFQHSLASSTTPSSPDPVTEEIEPFVQKAIGATGGYMYRNLMGKLKKYPIPELPLPYGQGQLFLELGCNWGRWSCAASGKGYRVISIDPNREAIETARRVAQKLKVSFTGLVADARYLPFHNNTFDVVFSYSVLQHFEKSDVRLCIAEMARVLGPQGYSFIQMLSTSGLRNGYIQAARGFRKPKDFEVRYWSPAELKRDFGVIGKTTLSVDGFFSANAQYSDRDILSWPYRRLVELSAWLRRCSQRFSALIAIADSLYVRSSRSENR